MWLLHRFSFFAIFIPLLATAQTVEDFHAAMERAGTDPTEYILNLFDKADVVVIGECDHRDTTQYDIVRNILHDKRFAAQVRYVYTEVGATNCSEQADSLVHGSYSDDENFRRAFLNLCRNENFPLVWEKTNRFMLVRDIYRANKSLPDDMKIRLRLTDLPLDWTKIRTPRQCAAYDSLYNSGIRDRAMAENFIKLYKSQKPVSGKRKALLITNYPHALCNAEEKSEGYFLKKYFGKKVNIILFNYYNYAAARDNDSAHVLMADGKWDAAFEQYGKRPVALSLRNTPFGTTRIPVGMGCNGKTFASCADGMIFYKPFYEFCCMVGIPDVLDTDFKDEFCRRAALFYNTRESEEQDRYSAWQRYYNGVRTFRDYPACAADELRRALGGNAQSPTSEP